MAIDPDEQPFEFANAAPTVATADEFDPLQFAWRYKWLLAGGLIAGLLLGYCGQLFLGDLYQAKGQILVSKRAAALQGDTEAATFGDRSEHIAIIQSPMIVRQAVETHHLTQLPTLSGSDDPVEDILSSLRVKRTAGIDKSFLNVFEIYYQNPSAADAEAIVTAIIDAYRTYLSDTQSQEIRDLLSLLAQTNADLRERLDQEQQEYLTFRDSAPLHWRSPPGAEPGIADLSNVHQDNLRALEAQQRANMLLRTELKSRLEALRQAIDRGVSPAALDILVRQYLATSLVGGRTGSGTNGVASPLDARATLNPTNEVESRLLPLLLDEERLSRDYGPDHPDLQAVRDSIATIRAFYANSGERLPRTGARDETTAAVDDTRANRKGGRKSPDAAGGPHSTGGDDLVQAYLSAGTQQLHELDLREAELARLSESAAVSAKEFARCQALDQAYREELDRGKSLWVAAVERVNQVNLDKDGSGYTVREMAPVRSEFVIKRPIKVVGAATAFSLVVAAGIAFLLSMYDTTLRSVSEVQRYLTAPVLGTLPFRPAVLSRSVGNRIQGNRADSRLYYLTGPNSPDAEALRTVRTAIFAQTGSQNHRVLQIVSPADGDGKSTLVANLAIAMAQAGRKVLLVDADLRSPNLHTVFGLTRECGLSDALLGEVDVVNAIRETRLPQLHVLTAGTASELPGELLASSQCERVMSTLKRDYEFVLVDTPSLLVVNDPCIMAQQADAVMLLLNLACTNRAALQQTIDLLQSQGVCLSGVIACGPHTGSPQSATSDPSEHKISSQPHVTDEMCPVA